MQNLFLVLFYIGLFIVFYTYIGYGILIFILTKLKKERRISGNGPDTEMPEVTLLIAAYNEEAFVEEKIKNTLALDYPKEKLKVFFVTDGSTDRTPELIRKFPGITLFHENGRKGKIHAVNRVMKFVKTPITIFCDANTYLNHTAIKNIVRHYADPTVGGVAGEKRIFKKESDNASGSGEGFYWKYESFLKRKDAELYSIVGAAGELFSVRTNLFEAPAENMIIEDFYLSMRITANGYRFAYEPEAYATETASASVEEEWKRKVRISAGGFQAMGYLLYLLNPFRYGLLSFQYFSHRVLRWTLAPLSLVLVFITNIYLAWTSSFLYSVILALQIGFYLLAFLGFLLRNKSISIKGFFVPYYFVVMNAAVFAGFVRHFRGKQSVMWERAKRAELNLK
jgi:poly-beta-1,6-N-acetyl-D-glucosamine synthase